MIGVRRLSVRLMSRTSALTRKPKGLGRLNFAQGYPRSHATPTPTSRSKGQMSRWGGGIMWRPPSRTACFIRKTTIFANSGAISPHFNATVVKVGMRVGTLDSLPTPSFVKKNRLRGYAPFGKIYHKNYELWQFLGM